MKGFKVTMLFLSVLALIGLWAAPMALAEEKPQYGGILEVAQAVYAAKKTVENLMPTFGIQTTIPGDKSLLKRCFRKFGRQFCK